MAASRSWRGVLRSFEITASRHARRFQQACDQWGIDYSHFGARTWTDDQLCRTLSTAGSWHEVMGALGYPEDSGSARATTRKHAAQLRLHLARLTEPAAPGQGDPFAVEADARHPRAAGAYLVAGACALQGHRISWPLEPARDDLLVDTGGIERVQVKTTTWRCDGAWAYRITHAEGGAKAWYTAEEIDHFGSWTETSTST